MALDLETLMQPVPGDDPAGPDLSYDDERHALEQMFERPVSMDATGAQAEADGVDWREAFRLIESQSLRTKDIWLPVYLCRAGAAAGSLETVETGAEYLAAMLEQLWETMHPSLEEDGFQGRKGPCDSLVGYAQFVGPLGRMVLLQHPRLGRFSGADFVRFRKNAEAEDGYGPFRAALEAIGEEGLLETVGRIERVETALRRADAVLTSHAEGTTSTNFNAAYAALGELKTAVKAFSATPEPAAAGPDAQDTGVGQDAGPARPAGRAGAAGAGGKVETRQDVIAALDTIVDYYRRHEPASPIPLMIQRVREWVTLDFLAVLGDIAPASLDEARRVLLSRAAQENSGF